MSPRQRSGLGLFALGVTVLAACTSNTGDSRRVLGSTCPDPEAEPSADAVQVWADDFDGPAGTSPAAESWQPATGGGGWGNFQQQTYTGTPDNLALSGDGELRIVARPGSHAGLPITSARITSRRTFRYGYLEARMKMPSAPGLWPAFWTQGANMRTGVRWSATGEIDIAETSDEGTSIAAATHVSRVGTPLAERGAEHKPLSLAHRSNVATAASEFHDYGVAWTSRSLTWYVDRRPVHRVCRADQPAGFWRSLDRPHVLILNLAVGGHYPRVSQPTLDTEHALVVAWVRAWNRTPKNPQSSREGIGYDIHRHRFREPMGGRRHPDRTGRPGRTRA